MPTIEISENTHRKLMAFKKVIDVVIEKELPNESAYGEMVISIGLDRMLQDPLPKEDTLLWTMVGMFKKNPEFVCDFIAETLREGEKI